MSGRKVSYSKSPYDYRGVSKSANISSFLMTGGSKIANWERLEAGLAEYLKMRISYLMTSIVC